MPRTEAGTQRNEKLRRPLAQLVEQLAFNQFVEGSNPSRPTTSKLFRKSKKFQIIELPNDKFKSQAFNV